MPIEMMVYKIQTRWPANQVGPTEIEINVPMGGHTGVLSTIFTDEERLTDAEIEKATYAAIRAILVKE